MLLCHSTYLLSTVRSMDTIKAMYVNGCSKYFHLYRYSRNFSQKCTVIVVAISAENLNKDTVTPLPNKCAPPGRAHCVTG